jgi:hypothetical protein
MGGGSTWLIGSYDPETHTLYWPTGSPFPDSKGAERGGDNLYTDSILAVNPANGSLKWHYRFTPHDVSERDATEPPVLVNAAYLCKPRKLLLHCGPERIHLCAGPGDGRVVTGQAGLAAAVDDKALVLLACPLHDLSELCAGSQGRDDVGHAFGVH